MANFKACLDSGKTILFLPPRLTIDNVSQFRSMLRALVENNFKDRFSTVLTPVTLILQALASL